MWFPGVINITVRIRTLVQRLPCGFSVKTRKTCETISKDNTFFGREYVLEEFGSKSTWWFP